MPFGAWISAISPIDLPKRPLPMGELTEILWLAKSASDSDTGFGVGFNVNKNFTIKWSDNE